jgi:hypothetical protein
MHGPFVFSCILRYPSAAIAVLFYLQFVWGCAPPPLSHGPCYTLATIGSLPSPSMLGEVAPLLPSLARVFIYSSGGTVLLSPSPVELSSQQPLLQALPTPRLLGRGHHTLLLQLACLFTVCMRECTPHSPELRAPCPLLLPVSFFFQMLVYYSGFGGFFPFFLGWGSVCSGGYADLSQGVPRATYLLTWCSPKQVRSWCLTVWEPS